MVKVKELKLKARRDLIGNYGTIIGAYLLVFIFITIVIGMLSFAALFLSIGGVAFMKDEMRDNLSLVIWQAVLQFVIQIIAYAAMAFLIPGCIKLHMRVCNGEKAVLKDLMYGLNRYFYKYFVVGIFIGIGELILFLPMASLMFACVLSQNVMYIVIGGIVSFVVTAALIIWFIAAYSQTYLILTDTNCSIYMALKGSRIMMSGNKMSYIYMNLSFIGIGILSTLSYIGMLWVMPYYSCTLINFYNNLPHYKKN